MSHVADSGEAIALSAAWVEAHPYNPTSASPTTQTIYQWTNTGSTEVTHGPWVYNKTYIRNVQSGDPDEPFAPWHSDLQTVGNFNLISSYGSGGELIGSGETVTHTLTWTTSSGSQEWYENVFDINTMRARSWQYYISDSIVIE